jgi:transposase
MHIVHDCQSPLSKKGEENVQREDLASGIVSIVRQRCILD